MEIALVVLNGAGALGSGAAGALGVARPGALLATGEAVTSGVDFYARIYAVRAIPLSIAVVATLLLASPASIVPLLIVAGVIQAGDSALGVIRRVPGMAVGAGVLAVVHLLSAHCYTTL